MAHVSALRRSGFDSFVSMAGRPAELLGVRDGELVLGLYVLRRDRLMLFLNGVWCVCHMAVADCADARGWQSDVSVTATCCRGCGRFSTRLMAATLMILAFTGVADPAAGLRSSTPVGMVRQSDHGNTRGSWSPRDETIAVRPADVSDGLFRAAHSAFRPIAGALRRSRPVRPRSAWAGLYRDQCFYVPGPPPWEWLEPAGRRSHHHCVPVAAQVLGGEGGGRVCLLARSAGEGSRIYGTRPRLLAIVWLAFLSNSRVVLITNGHAATVAKDIFDVRRAGYLVASCAFGACSASIASTEPGSPSAPR